MKRIGYKEHKTKKGMRRIHYKENESKKGMKRIGFYCNVLISYFKDQLL